MTIKGYSVFPKAPALLEFHHQIFSVISGGVLPLYREAVGLFYTPRQLGKTDNVSSYVSKLTRVLFEHERFTGEKIIECSLSIPDLNLIKKLWSFVKMKSYEGRKQYNGKVVLSEANKIIMSEIEPAELKKKQINA